MYKNLLQERAQKKKVALPFYETERVGGEDHKPTYISIVTLHDGRSFQGPPSISKKKAEIKAAEVAWNYGDSSLSSIPIEIKREPVRRELIYSKVSLFIDAENKFSLIDKACKKLDQFQAEGKINEFDIHLFASCYHHNIDKLKEITKFASNIFLHEAPTGHKNAADVMLIWVLAGIFKKDKTVGDLYLVITGDSFGHALIDIAQNTISDTHICSNMSQLQSFFE